MDKKTILSFTKIGKYLECGEKYRLHYVSRFRPIKVGSALILGKAVDEALNELLLHRDLEKALDLYHSTMMEQEINNHLRRAPYEKYIRYTKNDLDKELLPLFEKTKAYSILEDRNELLDQFGSLYVKGQLIIQKYYKDILPKIKRVIHIQRKVIIENADADRIEGYLDAIIEWEDSKIYLIDHKTTTVKYDSKSAKESEQLALYHFVMKDEVKLDGVGFIVLNKNIAKTHTKTCQICGKKYINSNIKTCNQYYNKKRCDGKLDLSIDYDVNIQLIFNEVDPEMEDKTLDKFDQANIGIQTQDFKMNRNACFGKFGKCEFLDICNKGDYSQVIQLEKRNK